MKLSAVSSQQIPIAVKRRNNKAHGVSRGHAGGLKRAPKGRKKQSGEVTIQLHGETVHQKLIVELLRLEIPFAPTGLVRTRRFPTAYAVGFIISPRRGYRMY